jgi:hypothetical protein
MTMIKNYLSKIFFPLIVDVCVLLTCCLSGVVIGVCIYQLLHKMLVVVAVLIIVRRMV